MGRGEDFGVFSLVGNKDEGVCVGVLGKMVLNDEGFEAESLSFTNLAIPTAS